jgi:hypothetical protein
VFTNLRNHVQFRSSQSALEKKESLQYSRKVNWHQVKFSPTSPMGSDRASGAMRRNGTAVFIVFTRPSSESAKAEFVLYKQILIQSQQRKYLQFYSNENSCSSKINGFNA